MKKLWSIILLIGLVNAQMPEPTMVGQDKLQVPTLSINNFVNQAEIEGLEDTRVFLGITNILTENVMDSRYDLVEQDSDFELTARVIYLGRPRTATTFLGLFRRETSRTEVRVIVDPRDVNDREAAALAREIAKAVEENLTYPGEVKVAVMRETRSVEYARW